MHALVFDLDGTLVDSVYAHVLAWQGALDEAGFQRQPHHAICPARNRSRVVLA